MKPLPIALILPVMALTACGGEETAASGGADADTTSLQLVLMDSIGVELGDSGYVFGSIEGLGFSQDGNIVVLDRVSADIRIFSPEGQILRTIGGRGSGPGEMHNPLGLFIFPDGRLGALDPWKSGLLVFSQQGEYLGMGMEISNNVHIFPEVVDDSSFIALKTDIMAEPGSVPRIAVFVGLFRMSDEPEVTYFRDEMPADLTTFADMAQKYLLAFPFAVDTLNDLVYVAPFNGTEYRIERFSLDGEFLGCMELEIDPVPLTEDEIRLEKEYISQRLASFEGGEPDYNIQLSDPITNRIPVVDLEIGPDGNLWARRGTEDSPFFDVWSPEGERLGSVVMPELGPASRSWNFEICPQGILAYDTDPDYYQKIYIIDFGDQAEETVPITP
jgi:hypothetical protein